MELPFVRSDAETDLGQLPDLLTFNDGTPVRSKDDWYRRRNEIYEKIIPLQYGGMPPKPDFDKITIDIISSSKPTYRCPYGVMGTRKLVVEVTVLGDNQPLVFDIEVWIPPADKPVPAVIYGDDCWQYLSEEIGYEVLSRGFALVVFNRCKIARDRKDARSFGIYKAFPGDYGVISAWAWGYHRVIDALNHISEIDISKIMITGHSRGGKAVQLAAATDERIAFVADNNSGCCGFGLHRVRGKGAETISDITRNFGFWFEKDFSKYAGRENELPFDQHFLSALIAPRGLRFQVAFDDLWANGIGACENYRETMKVYRLLDADDNFSIAFRESGHSHRPEDWTRSLDFAIEYFKPSTK